MYSCTHIYVWVCDLSAEVHKHKENPSKESKWLTFAQLETVTSHHIVQNVYISHVLRILWVAVPLGRFSSVKDFIHTIVLMISYNLNTQSKQVMDSRPGRPTT